MINVKYITGANNYVVNIAIVGDLPNSKTATVEDFDKLNYDCYKAVNGELVWDEAKYQRKLNPIPITNPQLSDRERIEQLEQMINLILMGEI